MKGPLFTGLIDAAISCDTDQFVGAHWGQQTHFAVLDIDASSTYHNQESLAELIAAVESVALKANLYQSSNSGGWHLYLSFSDQANSSEVEQTLKRWLKYLGYQIVCGQLEVFPSGNALRLPLQKGFAWLDRDGTLLWTREEVCLQQALTCFIDDQEANAQSWTIAKNRIESQIGAADRAAGSDAQERRDRLAVEGFEELFKYRVIQEQCDKARAYLASGLVESGTRHEAIYAIEHLLWHGDRALGVPALPGQMNADRRYQYLRAWLEQNHNGCCRHINRGDWDRVESHIRRACEWQPTEVKANFNYEPYKLTERAQDRLIELGMAKNRVFSMDDFRKANEDRQDEARAKIKQAVSDCLRDGRRISRRSLQAITGCSPNTLRKHADLWRGLSNGSGVLISGGRGAGVALLPCSHSDFGEEKKDSSDLEIEVSDKAGCVLDSLRCDQIGQTARNSRQETKEVFAAVHPIQSNSGVKHELSRSAPCVAPGGMDCGINGFLPASGSPPFNPHPAFFIGAPAPNLRQVGDRCDGLAYVANASVNCSVWISHWAQTQQLDKSIVVVLPVERAVGYVPLSCYVVAASADGRGLLSPNGYIACSSGDEPMANEAKEKPDESQRSAERQPEHTKQAQSEANAGSQSYADQVKAYRHEQKLSGKSKATGAGADAYGKGGLASAKDLLGDLAHGHPMLIADNDKPVLVAEKPTTTKQKLEPTEGPPIKLETVLSDYKTPFTEAFERSKNLKPGEPGKLEMLEETMRRLESVPWKEKLDVIFNPRAKNPEYNPVGSVITINPKHGTQRQIEEFVHEGFHATHQGIGALYINKPAAVSFDEYFDERSKGELGSFIAEIKVNAQLKNPKPVEFEHVVNGVSKIANLSEIYNNHGEKGLRDFLLDAKPVLYNDRGIAQVDLFQRLQTGETYREHYEKSYKTYVDTFQQAKPQAGAVLRDYQNKNPGKTAADFIAAGY